MPTIFLCVRLSARVANKEASAADCVSAAVPVPLSSEATRHLGETLANVRLKPDMLVACINRMGRILIPRGGDKIELGDTVIVVTKSDRIVRDLNDIFADGENGRGEARA